MQAEDKQLTTDVFQATQTLQRKFEELKVRAAKDALSGLLNRDTAERMIKKRLRVMVPGETCVLFIVDLDDFKNVNDTLGHQAGDQAIRQSAHLLSKIFNPDDVVGRLGGDEFLVFLSGKITEKLVRKKGKAICENLQMALGSSPSVDLTASVGAYLASGQGEHFEGLYQLADLALYKAKKAGKCNFCLRCGNGLEEEIIPQEDFLPVNTIPLSGLLEYMDSGVALLEMGKNPRLIYVSPSFCRILGVDPVTYTIPRPLSQLIHPDDLEKLENQLWQGLEENRQVDHASRISSDGTQWAWWRIRAVRIDYDNSNPVMLVTTTDISQLKESQRQLHETNQRLQTVFDQTAQGIWEVDVAKKEFCLYKGLYMPFQASESGPIQFPQGLLSNGWIHPSSAAKFREFSQELLSGQVQGYGNFVVRYHGSGSYGWVSLSYQMLYDDAGRACRAVGVVENLPLDLVGQRAFFQEIPVLPEALAPDLILGLRADLTLDVTRALWVEGKDLSPRNGELRCSKVLEEECAKLLSEEDREAFSDFFQREKLLRDYQEGRHWFSEKFRRVDGGGSVHWVGCVAHLTEVPHVGHVMLSVYLLHTDQRYQWASLLHEDASYDTETGLFGSESFGRLVSKQLAQGKEGKALAVVRLSGLSRLYKQGPSSYQKNCSSLISTFSMAMGSRCLVGCYGTEQLAVFFLDSLSDWELRTQFEEAFSFVRQALPEHVAEENLHFVVGVVRGENVDGQYQGMLAHAQRLCDAWRDAPIDAVVFLQEDSLENKLPVGSDGEVTVLQDIVDRPLSEWEKDVALQCLSAMIAASTLEESLTQVLEKVGSYYHADWAYLLVLHKDAASMEVILEWDSINSAHIVQGDENVTLEQFPLLKRCARERLPLFINAIHPYTGRDGELHRDPQNFTVFPLMEQGEVMGFFCVENPRMHPLDTALFSWLSPYLIQEKNRFQQRTGFQEGIPLRPFPQLNNGADVRKVAQEGRLLVYFQPQIDMRDGSLVRVEALVRGIDEKGNVVYPDRFIGGLEKNGAIQQLDLYMLEQTLCFLDQWQKQGRGIVPVSVNFSRVTLFDQDVLGIVSSLLKRYPDVPHQALELEITESAGNVETGKLQEIMDRFRALGVRFSLDDFGSQYANISVFTNVRFDTVKLDRSLISELVDNPINRTLIQDIVNICNTYGMGCVAEGVENQAQVDTLLQMGCICAQGYYYDRPLPVSQFEAKYLPSFPNK